MKRDMYQFLMLFVVILSYPYLFDSVHSLQLNSSTTTTTFYNCHPHQSSILLQLKMEFTFKRQEFLYYDEKVQKNTYPKMKHWKAGSDCCSWDGVSCDMATGHVISLDLSKSWLHGPLRSNSSLFRLLHLRKLNLAFNNFTSSSIPSKFGQLTRLTHLNLSNSVFSGHIPISDISRLANLMSIDLSFNGDTYVFGDKFLHMRERELRRLTQNMTYLRQIHLDWVNLSSRLPVHLANLSSLTHLSLQDCNLHGEFPNNIFHLPNIQFIHLSENDDLTGSLPEFPSGSMLKSLVLPGTNFSGKLPNSIGNLKFLKFLNLEMCSFSGIVPSSLGNLTELTYLDLTFNNFKGQLPYTLGNLAKLTEITLRANEFSGELPSSLGYLKHLKILDVSLNGFGGQIPLSLGNRTRLEVLELSTNLFSGKLPTSLTYLCMIHYLDMSRNSFSGVIPSFLFKMPSLTDLNLGNNQFSGYLNTDTISNSSHLESLYLSGNELSGQIPSSISKLTMLNELYLDSNHLSGTLDFGIFSNLSHLQYLDLSNNRGFFITNSSRNSTLPKFLELSLSSCNLSEFPVFLKRQDKLHRLDLSNNMITDPIPKWLLSIGTIVALNLSQNFISGWEEVPLTLPWKTMFFLDLHSNMLHGSLVVPPTSIVYFSISNNSLVGRIDPLFCKLGDLQYLDLSSNQLSGTIPKCLGNFNSLLSVLNLRRNNFHGTMPGTCGETNQLNILDFSFNNLHGKIPESLNKCKKLQVLNLGHNQISDTFPYRLQSLLSELKVLILSSNKFYGPVWHPHNFSGFASLIIIDLSSNDFSGSLPAHYFQNWISMIETSRSESKLNYIGDNSYLYSVALINKGLEMMYVRIFTFFVCIDFSNNKFYGEIPRSIGDLQSLIVLNLSSNNFSGHIPSSLGNLIELESLDLSNNKLSGEIPPQLTNLTFLEYLNFSENQLVGPIPQSGQIGTFSSSSFEGNWGLYGPPLSKKCETLLPPSEYSEESGNSILSGLSWKTVAIGYGCGFIIGLMIGFITTSIWPCLMLNIFGVIPPWRLR